MSVIYIVLPLAIIFALVAVWACIWAIRSGQFEDTQTPALRVLLDDSDAPAVTKAPKADDADVTQSGA
jgi:cbb3-type cytochrome oxidase maturation protein